jgi:parallel beta-helix repeat protein
VEGNNCSNNGIGIYLSSSSNNTLEDNLCISNSDGMFLYNACEDDSLIYNTCSWNDGDGTMIELSDRNYASWNDLLGNSQYGVEISSESHSNSISYNVFVGNHGAGTAYEAGHVQAYDSGSGNTWNVTEIFGEFGNYWGDWTTPNTDNDQIVDIPYEVGGSAGAKDNSPLAFDPRVTMPS